jgi:hypothetical protein
MRFLKAILLTGLPALVYTLLVVGSRLIAYGSVPPWVDWVMLLGSSSLVGVNPLVRRHYAPWARWSMLGVGFVLWSLCLFFVAFWIMQTVFGDSL